MAGGERLISASADLPEAGRGVRFDWPPAGGAGKGFMVRFEGAARAFVNRCPHLGVELDWQPGEFFEETGLYLVCSTHGALFDPTSGHCIAGPCKGASLEPIGVREQEGGIYLADEPASAAPTEPRRTP